MKKPFIVKIIAALCCFALVVTVVVPTTQVSAAKTLQDYKNDQAAAQKELDRLKSQKADQQKIKDALDKQISATQALIDECLNRLSNLNTQISSKQHEIDRLNEDMADDKALFKKRVRALYMSGSGNNLQILMGAESFSDYLVLAQMTKSVSAKDSKLIQEIIDVVEKIEAEQAEIQKLAGEQSEIKAELDVQKKTLNAQVAEVNGVIKSINSDISAAQDAYNKASQEIDKLNSSQAGNGNVTADPTRFLWPVPGYYRISAGWQSNDSVHKGSHKGIDISTGGVAANIVAIDDGYVYIVKNSCTHNYGKNYSCGCGGGYGNYVAIDHGKGSDSKSYKSLYGHMTTALVKNGQYVKRGQVIGKVGTTGWSTGYHLHLEIIVNGTKVNPKNYQYQR